MELNELNLSEEQLGLVQKFVQSETDKVRTDYSLKLKTANDELAKFKPVEKSDKEQELELKEKALLQKEQELANIEHSYQVANKLSEKGLPKEFAKYLNLGDDADKTLDEVSTLLNGIILNQSNKPASHTKQQAVNKSQFKEMSYAERMNLLSTNPELYKQLSK
ncbi:MAG TPA: DUF4355 domain-containing protein [Candidatus Dorea intestinavium]|nr:DUF4355 domain-containing protein [Candidatus Dorea intestinavium]